MSNYNKDSPLFGSVYKDAYTVFFLGQSQLERHLTDVRHQTAVDAIGPSGWELFTGGVPPFISSHHLKHTEVS